MVSEILHGKWWLLGVASIITGAGAVIGAITADSLPPLLALATGAAISVIWLWKAPKDAAFKATIESHTQQIAAWEARLDDEEKAHDSTRKKLMVCREALIEAGIRIKALETGTDEHITG